LRSEERCEARDENRGETKGKAYNNRKSVRAEGSRVRAEVNWSPQQRRFWQLKAVQDEAVQGDAESERE
jgi:hypothetical protein